MRITANSTALNNKSTSTSDIVTTQMMISGETFPAVCLQCYSSSCLYTILFSGEPPPPFRNHSHILIWTDHDQHDMFSLVLKRRLTFLKANICPILEECTFHLDKREPHDNADTVVIASKRHFPYGGKESGKTWTLILPDPDYHRAWLRHGSKRQLDLKLLISYLPSANWPLIKATFQDSDKSDDSKHVDNEGKGIVFSPFINKAFNVVFYYYLAKL